MKEIYGYGRRYADIIKNQEYELTHQEKILSAKGMFEKLDYEYHECDDRTKGKYIYYLKAKCIPDKINTEYIQFKKITFSLNGFTIENWLTDAYINKIKDINDIFIDNEELQAINQQMKEIGEGK